LLQWQLITLYNVPWISYFTAPHKHPPAALRELPWFASIWVLPFIKEYDLLPHAIVIQTFMLKNVIIFANPAGFLTKINYLA
jgi:hypothetical protein